MKITRRGIVKNACEKEGGRKEKVERKESVKEYMLINDFIK